MADIKALPVEILEDAEKDGEWYHILFPEHELCDAQLVRWDFNIELWQTIIIPNNNIQSQSFSYFMFEDGTRFSDLLNI